jgi:hypothetical protein
MVAPSTHLPRRLGNSYTASMYDLYGFIYNLSRHRQMMTMMFRSVFVQSSISTPFHIAATPARAAFVIVFSCTPGSLPSCATWPARLLPKT